MAKCPSEDVLRAIHSRAVAHVPQVDGWTEKQLSDHLNCCRRCRTRNHQIRLDMDTPTYVGDQKLLYSSLRDSAIRNYHY